MKPSNEQILRDALKVARTALALVRCGSDFERTTVTTRKIVLDAIEATLPASQLAATAPESAPTDAPVPVPFRIGNEYQTLEGEWVRFMGYSNEGTHYETMYDQHGRHRYTRRDFGRCTGTAHDFSYPGNVPPLYTHPAPSQSADRVRDAVIEEVAKWYADFGWLRDEADIPNLIRSLKVPPCA